MARAIATDDMPEGLLGRVQAMVEHCEMVNVRIVDFSAARKHGGEPVRADVESATSFHVSHESFANKFDWTVRLVGADAETVAELEATIIVEFSVDSDFVPDEDAASHIASTTGYFAAYPFAREIFASNTARLQINPLVLGLLRLSDMDPRTATNVSLEGAGDVTLRAEPV